MTQKCCRHTHQQWTCGAWVSSSSSFCLGILLLVSAPVYCRSDHDDVISFVLFRFFFLFRFCLVVLCCSSSSPWSLSPVSRHICSSYTAIMRITWQQFLLVRMSPGSILMICIRQGFSLLISSAASDCCQITESSSDVILCILCCG